MKRLMLFIGFMALLIVPVLSQEEVPVIPDWAYLYDNFGLLMATYLGIAAIASFAGEILVRLFKLIVKWQKVVVIMVLGVGVSFLGSLINVGYLAEASWWQTGLWGLLSGAIACGLRSGNILFFKSIVEFIISLLLPKEPTE